MASKASMPTSAQVSGRPTAAAAPAAGSVGRASGRRANWKENTFTLWSSLVHSLALGLPPSFPPPLAHLWGGKVAIVHFT